MNPSYLLPAQSPPPEMVAMRSRAPPSALTRTPAMERSLYYEQRGEPTFVSPPARAQHVQPVYPPPPNASHSQRGSAHSISTAPSNVPRLMATAHVPAQTSTAVIARNTTTEIDFHTTKISDINLDLKDYSIYDIAKLFNLNLHERPQITDEDLKMANKIRLKMHPDKSRMHEKYFLFFSDAYKRLVEIAEIINRCSSSATKKRTEWAELTAEERSADQYDAEVHELLKATIMKGGKFDSTTFNEKFDKYYGDMVRSKGYDDWFRSTDTDVPTEKVTKQNMNAMIEKQREKQRQMVVYKGVTEMSFPITYGTTLTDLNGEVDNYSGKGDFLTYMDLKEAHTETLIPVSMEDYEKMPKYRNVDEYEKVRAAQKFNYGTKEENERKLNMYEQEQARIAAELGMRQLKKEQQAKQQSMQMLGELRRIANY